VTPDPGARSSLWWPLIDAVLIAVLIVVLVVR
jgi:hypothetical protein